MKLVKSNLDFEGVSTIENLPDPTTAQQAATKAYVDVNLGGGLIETSVSANITLSVPQFSLVYATPISTPYTITLPSAASVANKTCYLKRQSSVLSNNPITVTSSDLIDGVTDYILEFDDEFVQLFSNGTTFRVIGE